MAKTTTHRLLQLLPVTLSLLILLGAVGCREIESKLPPTISVEKSYTTKPGRMIRISPEVTNDTQDAIYAWKLDGKVISTEKEFEYTFPVTGKYRIKFSVMTADGTAWQEILVDVVDLELPIIGIKEGNEILTESGEEVVLTPEIANTDQISYRWLLDGEEISTDPVFAHRLEEEGIHFVQLFTRNADGEDDYLIKVTVLPSVPQEIDFSYPQHSASVGRPMRLEPRCSNTDGVTFEWQIDGKVLEGETGPMLVYTPTQTGTVQVRVTAYKEVKGEPRALRGAVVRAEGEREAVGEAVIPVTVGEPDAHFRPFDPTKHSARLTQVFEYLPAPGQFINEDETLNTMEEANLWAKRRMEQGGYVSLGGFGGYLVVGFDHSIPNTGAYKGYDFAVKGNSFKGSSEPGIVWVMQDENGNGLPDDNWYELRGSETGKEGTVQDYEVTYYRPASTRSNVFWVDNLGNTGEVDWLGFHQQDSYYPLWVKPVKYTLRGTRLKSANFDQSGQGNYWINPEYEWGYVDNFSPIDRLTGDDNYNAGANANHFRISDAMDYDGKPIRLEYIDFIKVVTGLNTKSGWLGEISTECSDFIDLNVPGDSNK